MGHTAEEGEEAVTLVAVAGWLDQRSGTPSKLTRFRTQGKRRFRRRRRKQSHSADPRRREHFRCTGRIASYGAYIVFGVWLCRCRGPTNGASASATTARANPSGESGVSSVVFPSKRTPWLITTTYKTSEDCPASNRACPLQSGNFEVPCDVQGCT